MSTASSSGVGNTTAAHRRLLASDWWRGFRDNSKKVVNDWHEECGRNFRAKDSA